MHAEAFEIVVGIIECANLQLTTIARSRVHLSDVQGPAEAFAGELVDLPSGDFKLRLIGRLQRFGDDWCPEDILKQLGHRLRKDMRFSTLLRWFKYPL